jgi:Cu(I)/Ag(I) efflux system membrane fusion protein
MKLSATYSLILLSASLSFVNGCTKSNNPANGVKTPDSQTAIQKQVWTCPMHPQIRKDGPGKCPICGMDLVLAGHDSPQGGAADQAGLPAGHASIRLSDVRRQLIGVKTGVVEKRPLFKAIEGPGRVAFDPDLYTAQNEYSEALRQLGRVQNSPIPEVKHSAARMLESAKLRLKVLGLSDQQIRNLGGSESSSSSLLIPSPGDNLWIYAEVFEMDLPSVKPGLAAKIRGGSLGEAEVVGKVVSVDRIITPETRTAKVRIQLVNARPNLRPESFVNVSILSPLGEQIVIPFDAVLDTGKQAWAFVARDNGLIEPRLITVRFHAGDEIAVGSGLKEGERIVTSANFLIDSESRLKGAFTSEAAATGAEAKAPGCPTSEYWHAEMKMCMKKAE